MKSEYKIIADIITENTRVLDVGCNDGSLMEFLKKDKNVDIRGIEISKEKVQICISKGLTVIEGNAEFDLKQFPDKSFDYVVLGQTLQAFINPELVIKELLRVGNKAIVTIPNFGHWKVRLNLLIDEAKLIACVVDPGEAKPIIDFVESNNINLKYILNTHHHFDHVGGNLELKKRYNSKVIGFEGDKDRIPEIDTLVSDLKIWKEDNFEAKIYHIPGHTSGHIAFHFFKEKKIFTGDTLFSLGCGRIFEGTYEQMFHSLEKIKILPKDTEIYCGHEYTLQNSNFCLVHDSNNLQLKNKITKIKEKLDNELPTVPTTLEDEIQCNIFLKAKDLQTFSKLRDLKDNF